MSETYHDWEKVVNRILVDHEDRITRLEQMLDDLNIGDPEYAMPGELEAYKPEHRRVEAWPDKTQRTIEALQRRLFALETEVGHLRDDLMRVVKVSGGL